MTIDDDYLWIQDLKEWERLQDRNEQLELELANEITDEWEDGIPPEIQKLIDWYKED